LIVNIGAIHVGIMHAKFQASCFTGVGKEWGNGCMPEVTPDPWGINIFEWTAIKCGHLSLKIHILKFLKAPNKNLSKIIFFL